MKVEKLERKVEEWRKGDTRAFDFIYEKTNRLIYFKILYIVRDKFYAQDILQDTYVKAMNYLHLYKPNTNFTAWIVSIGKNLALNHVKKSQREISTDFDAQAHLFGTQETQIPFVFEVARKILPEDEYEIVMLCQVAGYKRREVSNMLSMPIGTVTWKNNQALKKLKEYLSKEGNL